MNKAIASAILAAIVVAADEPKTASIEVLKSDDTKLATYETTLSVNGNALTAQFTLTSVNAFENATSGNKMMSGVCGHMQNSRIGCYFAALEKE